MIATLIPAKGTSSRIPQKNLAMLGNKTLVEWSVMTGLELDLGPVYVSTECQAVASFCKGAEVIPRPIHLCRPEVTDKPVIEHFLDSVGKEVELLIYLRPTTPFREVEVVRAAVQLLRADLQASGLRSVQLLEEPPEKCFNLVDGRLFPLLGYTWEATELPSQKHDQVSILLALGT